MCWSADVLALSPIQLNPIDLPVDGINRTDENGYKSGCWIEADSAAVSITCYDNGIRNGLHQTFLKAGDSYYLSYENYFEGGYWSGPVISYYPTGTVRKVISNKKENVDFIEEQQRFFSGYSDTSIIYQALVTSYYESGQIKSTGWILFAGEDGDEIDTWVVGKWTIYGEDGKNLIETSSNDLIQEYYNF